MSQPKAVLNAAVLLAIGYCGATGQTPLSNRDQGPVHKEWDLSRRAAQDPTMRDGSIDDQGIVAFLQRLSDHLTASAGVAAAKIRVTNSVDEYAVLLRNRDLRISAGLLIKAVDEAEIVGLFAHALAHTSAGGAVGGCALAGSFMPLSSGDLRQGEQAATKTAISYLRGAGYDPTGLLSFLSRISYENPAVGKAILPEDSLNLRLTVEAEHMPQGGYRVSSSEFANLTTELNAIYARPAAHGTAQSESLSRRRVNGPVKR